jgi:hypothetical protein
MSGVVDDDETGTQGNGHAAVSDDDLRELLAQEKRARTTAEQRAATEREARARAERDRDEARGQATSATDQRWVAEEQSLEAGLAAAESEAEALEHRIAQLNADGSFAEAAKASRALARAEATIGLIGQKKEWLAQAKEMAKQPPPPERTERRAGLDLSGYSAKQRRWIEDHPEYTQMDAAGERFRARVAAAHYSAMADNIPIDSEDYFSHIESQSATGSRRQREVDVDEGDDPPPRVQRRDAGGALPVTRRAPGGNGARSGEVRLSPEQREAADFTMPDVPIDDYELNGIRQPGRYRKYAQLHAKLKGEGRLN